MKFFYYIKMGENAYLTYYHKNQDVILNRAKIIMKMIKRD